MEGWSLTSHALHFSVVSNLDKQPECRLNGSLPPDSSNIIQPYFFFPITSQDEYHLDCSILYDTVQYHYSRDFDIGSESGVSVFYWLFLGLIFLITAIVLFVYHQPLL